MKGFKNKDSYQMLYYMLENRKFGQRKMSDDLGWDFGQKVNSFVRWLEDLKFVRKTHETGIGKPRYEVSSRIELARFFSRSRVMADLILETYDIAADRKSTIEILSKNGGILCLTTALALYGEEYFRDPVIHAYVEDRKLLEEMNNQVEGKTKVILYDFDLRDEIKIKNKIKVTSPTRTIIDLFCNNLAYAAEHFIPKVWVK